MPKDFARAAPRGRLLKTGGRSWKWPFFSGLTLGLLVAVGVYLADRGQLDWRVLFGEKAEQGGVAAPRPAAVPRPRFDFYTILPEMEVVIPESDSPAPDYRGNGSSSAAPEPQAVSPIPAQLPAAGGGFILQAGSFRSAADADALKATLALSGLEANVQRVSINNDTYHRVRLGPFPSMESASQARNRLAQSGVQSLLLRLKN
jgi:cell division protein FtsN